MSLEWFSRMENAVRISLPDVCEEFDDFEILFDTNTTEQHPSFIFSIQTVDQTEDFCIIHFDPINQEFYSYHFHDEAELDSKVLFNDLDEMLAFIHASFHEHIGDIDDDILDEDLDDLDDTADIDDFIDEDDLIDDESDAVLTEDEYEEIEYEGDVEDEENIEWITNDKHIHIEDHTPNYEGQFVIHLKLGIDQETGDGVLFRNTFVSGEDDEEETEEKVLFYFKEEEAPYIIDMMNEYLKRG